MATKRARRSKRRPWSKEDVRELIVRTVMGSQSASPVMACVEKGCLSLPMRLEGDEDTPVILGDLRSARSDIAGRRGHRRVPNDAS